MAYAPNYYNYQVAVIFAIMLGGMLLLALVLGAIYFLCVVNMRNKGGKVARTASGRTDRSGRWRGPPPQQYQYQYPSPVVTAGQPPPRHQYQQPPSGEYTPRMPASPYTTALQQQYQVEPSQMQQQQHQHVQQPQIVESRIRELQPEFAYQQGPTTWTVTSPLRGEDRVGYAGSPQIASTSAAMTTGYHMSSV